MVVDAFGAFRGWCRAAPSCLEYAPSALPCGPADATALRCVLCHCAPQQHVVASARGYDPHSPEHIAERRRYDDSLLTPAERSAIRKAKADAAFVQRNFRTAYELYSAALADAPDSHVLLANRCQAYLKAGRFELALHDAQRAVEIAPSWAKAHFRLGSCLQRLQRPAEASAAFEAAASLDASNSEVRRALDASRKQQAEQDALERDLDIARKSTTRRQAYDAKAEAEYKAKLEAKRKGKIKELNEFNDELRRQFEETYEANWQPPPGVRLLEQQAPQPAPLAGPADATDVETDARAAAPSGDSGVLLEGDRCDYGVQQEDKDADQVVLESNTDGEQRVSEASSGETLLLEENDEEALQRNLDSGSAEAPAAADYVSEHSDDERLSSDEEEPPPDVFTVGSTKLTLPPRNYTLVHEDGRLHVRDKFEPMSFGMQRVHHETEPEPIWVQTSSARWIQSTSEVTIIPYTVPKELMRREALLVEFAPRQVHVAERATGRVFLHGELENRIDPSTSTWCTDGQQVTLTCVKQNLKMYDTQASSAEADTHWHRLFTGDQYTERGMIDADYSEMPAHVRRRNKMAELERKAKQKDEEERNTCPLCGKDVRFFCECRTGDKDYERPLPEGWKNTKLGFHDPLFDDVKYDMANDKQLAPRPPSLPQPYRGGR